jgi:hypothetical protein
LLVRFVIVYSGSLSRRIVFELHDKLPGLDRFKNGLLWNYQQWVQKVVLKRHKLFVYCGLVQTKLKWSIRTNKRTCPKNNMWVCSRTGLVKVYSLIGMTTNDEIGQFYFWFRSRNRFLKTGPFLTWFIEELSNSGSTIWYWND